MLECCSRVRVTSVIVPHTPLYHTTSLVTCCHVHLRYSGLAIDMILFNLFESSLRLLLPHCFSIFHMKRIKWLTVLGPQSLSSISPWHISVSSSLCAPCRIKPEANSQHGSTRGHSSQKVKWSPPSPLWRHHLYYIPAPADIRITTRLSLQRDGESYYHSGGRLDWAWQSRWRYRLTGRDVYYNWIESECRQCW